MSEQTGATSRGNPDTRAGGRFGPIAVLALHLIGVAAVAAVGLVVAVPLAHVEMLWNALGYGGQIGTSVLISAVIHIGISALVWFGLAGAGRAVWRSWRGRDTARRATVRSRGSTYVEFLVVLPVFLLLTFGLLQLILVNLGGALAHVAAYESARAVWLWQPEVQDRQVDPSNSVVQVNEQDVEDRARIAAALVMTPVAPGDYSIEELDSSDELDAVRQAMAARFSWGPQIGNFAQGLDFGDSGEPASLVKSLDSAAMPERAYRKLTVAYQNVDIQEIIDESDRTGVHFAYYQQMAMPFVNVFFGRHPHPSGIRGGNYFRWDIEYTLPPQRHQANRALPAD